MRHLSKINYKNEFVAAFPGEKVDNKKPRQTPGVLWSKATPTPVKEPRLIAWSEELGAELGIGKPTKEDINILSGNAIGGTMKPYAACYAGHQFGNWAGQLGDGRAITLAEHTAPDGGSWELQLKGAGPTPYSRRADGRAVLRSSVREYLMSEAMHYLGVPTTRALSLVSTGDQVLRDMFYDGHPAYEPGAIVMRVAPSFLRFGNYEILAARREQANLQNLVDWTITKHYSHIGGEGEKRILDWFTEVVQRTAKLMTEWLRVGFVHGVMNTDNMSILGLTIDYGPYSFLDDYDPTFTPNTTDLPGRRYAFGRQPSIGYWNLGCLAGALAPLFKTTDALVAVLDTYKDVYAEEYYSMMSRKLGLKITAQQNDLITRFEKTLTGLKADMTMFYQLLISMPVLENKADMVSHFSEGFYEEPDEENAEALYHLMSAYTAQLGEQNKRIEEMKNANPRFILRNYLLHQAIEELEKGADSLFRKLEQAIKDPYGTTGDEFFVKRPDWAGQKAGCSMLSCSS